MPNKLPKRLRKDNKEAAKRIREEEGDASSRAGAQEADTKDRTFASQRKVTAKEVRAVTKKKPKTARDTRLGRFILRRTGTSKITDALEGKPKKKKSEKR